MEETKQPPHRPNKGAAVVAVFIQHSLIANPSAIQKIYGCQNFLIYQNKNVRLTSSHSLSLLLHVETF